MSRARRTCHARWLAESNVEASGRFPSSARDAWLMRSVHGSTQVRWQGGDLGRLLSARHSAMHEAMAQFLLALGSWVGEPEVSFSVYGERGVIDVLAWHPSSRTVL